MGTHAQGSEKRVQATKALFVEKIFTSVHISFTFSKIILQCLSKAFTLPKSFLLFLQLMSTCRS